MSFGWDFEVPPFVLRMGSKEAQTYGAGKGGSCGGLRQPLHTQGTPQTNLLAKNPGGESVNAGNLTSSSCQDDGLTRQTFKSGGVKACPNLFEDFFGPWAHDPDQLSATNSAAITVPVSGLSADLDHLTIIHASRLNAAVQRLDSLSGGIRNLKTYRDVAGNVIAAETDAVGVNHMLPQKDRDSGRATAHVDAGAAQFLLVLDQGGDSRSIGRGSDPGELEVTALDTVQQGLHRGSVNREKVKVGGKTLTNLATRVSHTGPVIKVEVHRLSVEHLAISSIVRHVASAKHATDVNVCNSTAMHFCGTGHAIRPRTCSGKAGNDVIDALLGHFLGGLDGSADCTFGFLHLLNFTEPHPTGSSCRRADHPERGLSRHRSYAFRHGKAVGSIKAQHEAGDLGCADVKDRDDSTVHRGLAQLPHRSLTLIKLSHHSSGSGSVELVLRMSESAG